MNTPTDLSDQAIAQAYCEYFTGIVNCPALLLDCKAWIDRRARELQAQQGRQDIAMTSPSDKWTPERIRSVAERVRSSGYNEAALCIELMLAAGIEAEQDLIESQSDDPLIWITPADLETLIFMPGPLSGAMTQIYVSRGGSKKRTIPLFLRAKADGQQPQQCTRPSGDGSLRWPCPAHPPEQPQQGGDWFPDDGATLRRWDEIATGVRSSGFDLVSLAKDSADLIRRLSDAGGIVDEAMVERAAIALQAINDCSSTPWHDLPDYGRNRIRDQARAALCAALGVER